MSHQKATTPSATAAEQQQQQQQQQQRTHQQVSQMHLKVIYTLLEKAPDGQQARSTTHIARTTRPVAYPADELGNPVTFLKTCLLLICYTRPDLMPNQLTDYAVSVLDVVESAESSFYNGGPIYEGQGMMGWALAEKGPGMSKVGGKFIKSTRQQRQQQQQQQQSMDATNSFHSGSLPSNAQDVLEVVLTLKPCKPMKRGQFVNELCSGSSFSQSPTREGSVSSVQQAPTSPAASGTGGRKGKGTAEASASAITDADETSAAAKVDNAAMMAMLQALMSAAAGLNNSQQQQQQQQGGNDKNRAASQEFIQQQARQMASTLGSNMALLPGLDLFNPMRAKAIQQQASAPSPVESVASATSFPPQPQPQPGSELVPMRRPGRPKGSLNRKTLIGAAATLQTKPSSSSTSSSAATAPQLAQRPVLNERSSSLPDARRRAETPVSSVASTHRPAKHEHEEDQDASISHTPAAPSQQRESATAASAQSTRDTSSRGDPERARPLKTWEAGCALCAKTESVAWRAKVARARPLYPDGPVPKDAEIITQKICDECAQRLPSKSRRKRRMLSEEDSGLTDGESTNVTPPATMMTSMLPNTSPLRRSPRRHNNSNGNIQSSTLKQSSLLSVQPLTSPGGATGRYSAASTNKRRRFTSALSAAALREEDRVASGLTPKDQMLPPIPPHRAMSVVDEGTPSLVAGNLVGLPNSDLAKEIFGNSDTATVAAAGKNALPKADDLVSHEDESFDFFLKSSPGTIMRSFNLASPRKDGQTMPNGTGDAGLVVQPPAFAFSLSPLRPSAVSVAVPQGTSAVFAPLGSSLSTPFRNLLNTGKGRERATSEQPPASHSKLIEELDLLDEGNKGSTGANDAHHRSIPSLTQFISSDDNLLGAGSNVQINLLPPTADRRLGGTSTVTKAKPAPSRNTEDQLSDSMLNEFTTFFLDSSGNLFSPTPFNPKADSTGKPALTPLTLQFDNVKQQSLSPLACLSSEMDIDLSNLPPSSPPPLPGSFGRTSSMHASSTSIANMEDFWSTFNSGLTASTKGHLGFSNLDDGQSPISVTTTVTQGGTPQETLPHPHQTDVGKSDSNVAGTIRNPVMEYIQQDSFGDSPLSLDTDGSVDPLFNYFPQYVDSSMTAGGSHAHHRQSSTSSVSSAFLEKLKGGPVGKAKSSSMALTWSDSTASSSSIVSMPVADLTARSKLARQQVTKAGCEVEAAPKVSLALDSPADSIFSPET